MSKSDPSCDGAPCIGSTAVADERPVPSRRGARLAVLLCLGSCVGLFGCGVAGGAEERLSSATTINESSGAADGAASFSGQVESQEEVELFPAIVGNKTGFIDRSGRLVIDARFHWAGHFSEGLAWASEGDTNQGFRYGYVDATGSFVVGPQYRNVSDFVGGLAGVLSAEDGWGYIDRNGRFVIEPQYSCADSFGEGLAAVETTGGWGFIDGNGEFFIKPQYLSAWSFSEGLAAVGTSDGRGFIDKTGEFVIQPSFLDVGNFRDGLAPVARDPGGAWWFGEWGFIDTKGALVIPFQFAQALEFGDGLAPVLLLSDAVPDREGGWYFIDETGEIVLGPFEGADPFRDGLAWVITREGMNAYIDTTGRVVWESKNIYWDVDTTTSTQQ